MSKNVLEVKHLNKYYNDKPVIQDLDFNVEMGSVYGLLGPNGAGKTTLIRMITAITKPNTGEIWLNSRLLTEEAVQEIGYMPEERGLYKKMTVGDQLIYLAQLKGLSRSAAEEAVKKHLEKWQISDWFGKKVDELSKGMQQKVQFIATVIHKPKLIILDEPLTGLDPINAQLINDEILELRDKGSTIIFSTHRMEQVEEICDSILLINKGLKVLDGRVDQVKQEFKLNQFKVQFEGELEPLNTASFGTIKLAENEAVLEIKDGSKPSELLKSISEKVQIYGFNEILPSLNEIFIRQVSSLNVSTMTDPNSKSTLKTSK